MEKTHSGYESARRDWRTVARAWGPPGNARLTASTGLVLLALLAVETLTLLALRTFLPVHIFLGLLLVPPVALKLASTGWRFLRYYTRDKPYRLEGPPRLFLRVLAPLLVASTLLLFGSGVALIVSGHGGGLALTVHRLSFIAWGVLLVIHVVAYFTRTLRLGPADWRRNAEDVVAGARSRRAALSGALLAGIIVALATYPAQQAWLSHRHDQRHHSGAGVGELQAVVAMGGFSGLRRTLPAREHDRGGDTGRRGSELTRAGRSAGAWGVRLRRA
jgi:hypothetical protein